MRLLPAHQREAKSMARGLFDAFKLLGVPRPILYPFCQELSLQQCQELMARSMGYSGWGELTKLVQRPHNPVYLDTIPSTDSRQSIFNELVLRMSVRTGSVGPSMRVKKAIEIAGVGISLAQRGSAARNASRRGLLENAEPVAPGIEFVFDGTYGRYKLSPERNARMPEHLKNLDGFYEEDLDFNLVIIAFPDEAEILGQKVEALLALRLFLDEHRTLDDFEREVVSYIGDCVRSNQIPFRFPHETPDSERDFRLIAQSSRRPIFEWASTMSTIPKVAGKWPTRPGPWFDHWNWSHRIEQSKKATAEIHYEHMKALLESSDSKGVPLRDLRPEKAPRREVSADRNL